MALTKRMKLSNIDVWMSPVNPDKVVIRQDDLDNGSDRVVMSRDQWAEVRQRVDELFAQRSCNS